MSSTAFVNGSTLTDASWFNDVNIATYSVLGDATTAPATAIAAMKNLFKKGADIASASTANLATATGNYIHITGTTTINAFGTVNSGVPFMLIFDGALTLTYNGTSLILPGAGNIVTSAGDSMFIVSEGSGNWRCFHYTRAIGFSSLPSGVMLPYGGSTIPSGFLACDGSSLLRATYPNLFTAIGTTWGSADGTHFNVPDTRGRTLIGDGTGSGLTARTLGTQNIGEETHALTIAELAAHTHTIDLYNTPGTGTHAELSAGSFANTEATSSTGSGTAHNVMQPSAVVKHIISI